MTKCYLPLPASVELKTSTIHGLGLFSTQNIKPNIDLGMSHYLHNNEIVRTPLGGFYNHSTEPNIEKRLVDGHYHLFTLKQIAAGDELVATYTFYNPTSE